MSHFILHTKSKGKASLGYLIIGLVCILAASGIGYAIHRIGTASAKSREKVLIYTEEELEQYLLDEDSEEYNLNGRYQLEADLDLGWLYESIGTGIEPFTGTFDGNGHVITGLKRPMFGVVKDSHIMRLFFSEVSVTEPFTYYDGEHYVDGYGALAAYAVDSTIHNCGMAGEIYTASPAEAEYQLAKASPAEAGEGPGVEGGAPSAAETLEESLGENEESGVGPGDGTVAGNDSGPGVETADNTAEGTVATEVIGPGVEGSTDETGDHATTGMEENNAGGSTADESEAGTTAGNTDNTTAGTEESMEGGAGTEENTSGETAESTTAGGSGEGGTGREESPSEEDVENTAGESGTGSAEGSETGSAGGSGTGSAGESGTGSAGGSGTGSAGGSGTGSVGEIGTGGAERSEANGVGGNNTSPETVGYQAMDRQPLMLKISTVTDMDAESVFLASPSDATPSDAEPPTETGSQPDAGNGGAAESEETGESLEYIGNPNGDIFILVTADRVTVGGLVAETAGSTLISNCYTLVTISSELQDIETYSGGLAGILGMETRTENSYAAGLADSDGVTGGFAAGCEGTVENCYSTVIIGENGSVRGAFMAEGSGTLTGCIYDRQMACVPEETEAIPEQNLQGLDTVQLTGADPQIPGTWYTAEQAYPQIEYFAFHEQESIAKSSRVSAIALILPEGDTLTDVLHEDRIVLPSQIDGQEIVWEAEGSVKIDANNQLTRENVTFSEHEAPMTQSALESSRVDAVSQEDQTAVIQTEDEKTDEMLSTDNSVSVPESEQQTASQDTFSLTAGVNDSGDTKVFRLRSAAREAAVIAASWADVGSWQTEESLRATDITMPDGTTRKMLAGGDGSSEENAYVINCPEALAWFAYMVNNNNGAYRKKCARLNADIDLSGMGKDYTTITSVASDFSNCLPWIPIANNPNSSGQSLNLTYDGTFDGGGYDIQNLYIIGGGFHTGFISTTRYGTVVKNVRIVSGYVRGTDRVAAVVGVLTGANGTLLIENCYNAARVESVLRSGGVACNTAGILGKTFGGTAVVRKCVNVGTISSYRECVGIAIGAAMMEDCYNLGDVIQTGLNHGSAYYHGIGTGTARNCFNAGKVIAAGGTIRAINASEAVNCYYQTGLPGAVGNVNGGTLGLSESAMKSWALPFALNGQSMNGIWKFKEGEYPGYGQLERPENWETVGQGGVDGLITMGILTNGDGTAGTPYEIANAEQLATFAAMVKSGSVDKNVVLTMDINLAGERYGGSTVSPIPWIPIGDETNVYQGTFDGGGKAIGHMKVEKDGIAGLFGCAGGGAMITGVGIDSSCKVTSTGTVSGDGTAALVGMVKSDGTAVTQITIQNCYSRTVVTSGGTASGTGAFVGSFAGTPGGDEKIANCYNAGPITVPGGNPGAIAGTFFHGTGGGIKNCYWDSETSGGVTTAVIAGGAKVENSAGKTTAVMKNDGDSGILNLLNANLGTGIWYRVDTRNDGYPVFKKSETEVTWADVGAAVMAPRSRTSSSSPGTEADPYLIWTAEELAWFAYQVNNVSGQTGLCAELMADINLFGGLYSGHAYDPNVAGYLSKALLWEPIGSSSGGLAKYFGTFHGNGHTVSGMRVGSTTASYQGMFGVIGDNTEIASLTVGECQIVGKEYIGGIAGFIHGSGITIKDCKFTGKITGDSSYAGGIAGLIRGTETVITRCRNSGEIECTDYVGGIAGVIDAGGSGELTITECWNSGNVTGKNGSGPGGVSGGIAGGSNVTSGRVVLDGCYNSGSVSSGMPGSYGANAGGIVGLDYRSDSSSIGTLTVRNCYNQGTVYGNSETSSYARSIGGIAGGCAALSEVKDCYNTGQLTGAGSQFRSIVGSNRGTGNITNCYYQTGCPADPDAKEVSEAGLKTWGAAFALNGEQLSQSTGIAWSYTEGNYPIPSQTSLRDAASWEEVGEAACYGLLDGAVPALSGTSYQIGTAEQLAWFARQINTGAIPAATGASLTGDINLSGSGYVSSGRLSWIPIGADAAHAYQGTFQSDPAGSTTYRIQSLYVDTIEYAGLFGMINAGGNVSQIGIVNADITGTRGSGLLYVGGIVGRLEGNAVISGCYNRDGSTVTGKGTGNDADFLVGGIVGYMRNNAKTVDCYNLATTITCTNGLGYAGGIVGQMRNNAVVSRCYNRGGSTVTAEGWLTRAGGIAGGIWDKSAIEDCYHLDSTVASTGTSSAKAGGIVGIISAGTVVIRDSYNACGSGGSITSSSGTQNTGGILAAEHPLSECYSEELIGLDTVNGVATLGTTDAARQSDVDSLNTTSAGERTGDARAWFTSLASEDTRGLPTLEAPQTITLTLNPADTNAGNTQNFTPEITSAGLRGIRQETGSSPVFQLTPADEVGSHFSTYGSTNANQYLGLVAGSTDLKTLTPSLPAPAAGMGNVSRLTLYTGAAYTLATDRVILIDLSDAAGRRYEIRVTIPGVTGKTLSVELPSNVTVDLSPDGTLHTDLSSDVSIINRGNYPVEGGILSLTQVTGSGYVPLKPVQKLSQLNKDNWITDTGGGVRLGIVEASTDPGGLIPAEGLYYDPASPATWMNCRLKGNGSFRYRYAVQYTAYFNFWENQYGFDVNYKFQVAEQDFTAQAGEVELTN